MRHRGPLMALHLLLGPALSCTGGDAVGPSPGESTAGGLEGVPAPPLRLAASMECEVDGGCHLRLRFENRSAESVGILEPELRGKVTVPAPWLGVVVTGGVPSSPLDGPVYSTSLKAPAIADIAAHGAVELVVDLGRCLEPVAPGSEAPAWDLRYDTTPARLSASGITEPQTGMTVDHWAADRGAYLGLLVADPVSVSCERTERELRRWSDL